MAAGEQQEAATMWQFQEAKRAESLQMEGDRAMAWAGIIGSATLNFFLRDIHELTPCFDGIHKALLALRDADPNDRTASSAALGKAQEEVRDLRGAVAKHAVRAVLEAMKWHMDTADVADTAAKCDEDWRRYA